MFSNLFFFYKNRTVYEIMWNNLVQPHTVDTVKQRMRFASRIIELQTHSEHNISFPLQQWFREGASMLRLTHNACLVSH
jgi:hypothetical protein